jgi:hypothetical protein
LGSSLHQQQSKIFVKATHVGSSIKKKKTSTPRGRTYGDDLCANVGESGLRENFRKAEETTLGARDSVELDERTGMFPITESDAIVIGPSTKVEDDSQNDQTLGREYRAWERVLIFCGEKSNLPVMVMTLIDAKMNSASPYAPRGGPKRV